jgi:hypothetical protein
MLRGRVAITLSAGLLAATTITLVAGALAPATARAASWQLESAPTPPGLLTDVSCTGPRFCMAVGDSTITSAGMPPLPGTPQAPLAERWNGATWSVVATPAGPRTGLRVVSCASLTFCLAGGYLAGPGSVIERWNGARWSIVTALMRPDIVSIGLSCPSRRFCIVAITREPPRHAPTVRLERLTGARWRSMALPRPAPGLLYSVACVSAKACEATGGSPGSTCFNTCPKPPPAAYGWNGKRWVAQRNPDGNDLGLTDVSCASAKACTAVGYQYIGSGGPTSLVQRRHAGSWADETFSPAVDGFTVSGVSCPTAAFCMADGSQYNTLLGGPPQFESDAEVWRGGVWSESNTPEQVNPAALGGVGGPTTGALDGVACTSPASCVGVGWYAGPNGDEVPLIDRYG